MRTRLQFLRAVLPACALGSAVLASAALRPGSVEASDLDAIYRLAPSPSQVYSEPVDVIAADAIVSPGRRTNLSAGLYRRGKRIFRAVSDTQVTFSVSDSTVGTAESNSSGIAALPYQVDGSTGQYLISASLSGNDLFKGATGFALLAVVSQDAPLILVDFDSALLKGVSGKFELAGIEKLRPMAGASEVLAALQQRYQIVYLTEYEASDLPKIRRWIHHWKMPMAPVLFWDRGEKVLRNDGWKSRELAQILKNWSNVRAALAGASSSMEAFRSNKVKTIEVRSKWNREPGSVSDWKVIPERIESR